MKNLSFQNRYYIFASVVLVWMVGYQSYHNHQTDLLLYDSLEGHNKSVNRYVEILNESRLEKDGLKHDLIHEQVMHESLKSHLKMLGEQIKKTKRYESKK